MRLLRFNRSRSMTSSEPPKEHAFSRELDPLLPLSLSLTLNFRIFPSTINAPDAHARGLPYVQSAELVAQKCCISSSEVRI